MCKGGCQKSLIFDWGIVVFRQPLRSKSKILTTSPYTGEARASRSILPAKQKSICCGAQCAPRANIIPLQEYFSIDIFTLECYDSFIINTKAQTERDLLTGHLRELAVGASHDVSGRSVAPQPERRTCNASRTLPRQLRQCLGLTGVR